MTTAHLTAPHHIRQKRDKAFAKLNEDRIPQSAKAEVRPTASRILQLERQLEAPTAFEQHVSGALQAAVEDYEAGKLDTLCSCANLACPLKAGRVPPPLRSRGTGDLAQPDPRELAVMWLERHRGDGNALRRALNEWDGKRSRYFELIEEMYARLYQAEADVLVQRLKIPANSREELRSITQQTPPERVD